MDASVQVDKKYLKKILGYIPTKKEFEKFVKDAVASKMFEDQFKDKRR